MSVVEVKQLFEGRSGSDNLERKRDYVQVWEVQTDDPADDATVAGGTPLLPRNGQPHPNDPFAVLIGINPVQDTTSPLRWLVTCQFSSDLPTGQQREALTYDSAGTPSETPGATSSSGGGEVSREDDPRNRPAVWELDWEQTTEIIRRDINGDAITNSAGDPYDPPPTIERSYPVLTVTKNVALDSPLLDIENQANWQEATNSDTPWGMDEKTMRFVRMKHRSAVENDIAYAEFTLSLKIKWYGWLLQLVDAGYRDLDGVWFTDPETKALPSDPKPLDGAGFELPVGDPIELIGWEVYRPIPFIPILALLGVTA